MACRRSWIVLAPSVRCASRLAAVVLLCALVSARVEAQNAGPGQAVVHTALGGFILGYDIDQTGTTGVLSEALTLGDGTHDVAVETFDQKTGKILKVVIQKNASQNDFLTLGIFGSHVGLIEFERTRGGLVDQRLYRLMNPVSGNRFSGAWTPPLTKDHIIIGASSSQGSSNSAFLAFENGGQSRTFVFGSDV